MTKHKYAGKPNNYKPIRKVTWLCRNKANIILEAFYMRYSYLIDTVAKYVSMSYDGCIDVDELRSEGDILFIEGIDTWTKKYSRYDIVRWLQEYLHKNMCRFCEREMVKRNIQSVMDAAMVTHESRMLVREAQEQLAKHFKKLSMHDREAIYNRFYCNMTFNEIACIQGVCLENGRRHTNHGLWTLRHCDRRTLRELMNEFYTT